MTDLDLAIKKVFDANNVKIYPFIPIANGKIQIAEIKQQFNCIIETYQSETPPTINGKVQIQSEFYMFTGIRKDLDVPEDVNPKQELLSSLCRKVIKELQYTKYNVKQVGDTVAGIYNTTALETGRNFKLTFEFIPR